ncbi:trk system potassium uptake protein TrkA [Cohaesibacter marisflavi]|uniref:Trk system potassium uptake protein TrkA n=1 Tax=Cohaesibacter marisflavi TaxID=655353 RepID=A0A1I5FG13_9HYPH|nr:Trk system potassium transporter TrkA [Cohaesibacter marisflavi]SFO22599.1 trk system potassium uptake protein TrkA [Cohaesibacter marisflavi]
MKVVICGAGQVGYGIAKHLSSEQNDVTVIDSSPRLVAAIRDTLDVRGYVGHGAHPDILARAGAKEADMIIAVTLYDEVNMVACQVAHSIFNVPTKVARVRAQSYLEKHYADLFSREHLPIDVIISPEVEVGEMVLSRMAMPGAEDTVRFADGEVLMIAIDCEEECPVVDTPLRQLTELFPDLKAVVVGIRRDGQLYVPHAEDHLQAGDLAYVVVAREQVWRTLSIFGHDEDQANKVVIAGGGNIGRYVALAIEERRKRTRAKVIEFDRDRAIKIANDFEDTIVLQGSALDQDILKEADIRETDTMIALTNNDQVNILSCAMAKRLGCARTMALLNDSHYSDLVHDLGIDSNVNPRSVTISKILQHVRRGRIRGVHAVEDGAAEGIEAEALETSPLVGRPLRSVEFPDGVRVGAIFRRNAVLMPDGDTTIQAGDRVILFALADRVKQVELLFRVSFEFF